MSNTYPTIHTVGLSGVLVTFAEALDDTANRAALAFRAAVDAQGWDWVQESATSLISAFFRTDLAQHSAAGITEQLTDLLATRDWFAAPLPEGRKLWHIPAVFGGDLAPQLDEAAEAAGLSSQDAIAELTSTRMRVITIGFAPGQPYLGTLGEHWNIPRLGTLSPNIPRGALVAAVRQLCLFSNDTPTGWRHVGQTAFHTFRPTSETPFPLSPGDELLFHATTPADYKTIAANNADGAGGATWEALP
ncbi:5-oxoprolinase subunit B family protein [Pseudosulfitobacter pseudonitzschiae]|uniref:5-oxoprolinase subunit B family protein n=1 Tax=Pseudosulfitobacter pseudonitzschiae TaxID=1402135 RepID=UPI001AF26FDF|nr:carboxyltransferase domain-containing protein [Pseudosulfitobacter pseudonitzschiae]MBM1817501.1 carboxyltransferase domain-containing protein [Pseudosulfitobacter pseudonitzschiae]MBM1834408.1 carboxyltransferase domain-containing protein [Pseudosulfitobacter pseudonitzschiae]MBM1839277.1 carboxyltransferase domain-containing protein [Pseudosulfitobacter pseudonitzschiae]MBM1844123.1 carboxyltransferase domain-containing protein [Pseudosulfitobacter pseudonitzschiae]MBM1848962.1 carboxyltr